MSTNIKSNNENTRSIFYSKEENISMVGKNPQVYIQLFHNFISMLQNVKLEANKTDKMKLKRAFGEICNKWGLANTIDVGFETKDIFTNLICDQNFITKSDQKYPTIISYGKEGMCSLIGNRLNLSLDQLIIRVDKSTYSEYFVTIQKLVDEVEALISEAKGYLNSDDVFVFIKNVKSNSKAGSTITGVTSGDTSPTSPGGKITESANTNPTLKIMTNIELDSYTIDEQSLFSRLSAIAAKLKVFRDVYDAKTTLTNLRDVTQKLEAKEKVDSGTPMESLYSYLSQNASVTLINDMSEFRSSCGASCTVTDLWNFVLDQTLDVISVNTFHQQTSLIYVEEKYSVVKKKVMSETCIHGKLNLTSSFIRELKRIRDLLLEIGFPVDEVAIDTGLRLQAINGKMSELIYYSNNHDTWKNKMDSYKRAQIDTEFYTILSSVVESLANGNNSTLSIQNLDALKPQITQSDDDEYAFGLQSLQALIESTLPSTPQHQIYAVSDLPLIGQSDLINICDDVCKEKLKEGTTSVDASWHKRHKEMATALDLKVRFPPQYCWACGLFNVSEGKCESASCLARKKNTEVNIIEAARQQLSDRRTEVSSVENDHN